MIARWRRWRAKPRAPLRRASNLHVVYLLFTGTFWVVAAQGAWAVLSGGADPSGGRGPAAAAYAAAFLAVASAMTWLLLAYLRRPVPPDPLARTATTPTPGERAREAAERRAWRSRP